jgi:hypothetical protein
MHATHSPVLLTNFAVEPGVYTIVGWLHHAVCCFLGCNSSPCDSSNCRGPGRLSWVILMLPAGAAAVVWGHSCCTDQAYVSTWSF